MNTKQAFRDFWLGQVQQNRGIMLAVGVVCAGLGLFTLFVPRGLFGVVIWFIGGVLIGTGLLKATQLVLGASSRSSRRRGWPLILGQVFVDVGLGIVLLRHRDVGASVLAFVFMILLLVEAVILFVMGTRAPTVRLRVILWITAIVIFALALVSIFCTRLDPVLWVSVVTGLKLIVFGIALLSIVAFARATPDDVYDQGEVTPIVGELYAVHFGAAFHLGVFVGDDRVVHYLDDNNVWHVTWETFLEGRYPHHWSYPDLPLVSEDLVVATALGEVGKTYPYSFLKHNCEHFAIYCKSGGTTQYSKFAQVPSSLSTVAVHPFVGMIAEMNMRIFEFLAFHLGGPSGKELSLTIRRIGSIVTMWLITRGERTSAQPKAAETLTPGNPNPSG